jgi:hypothetical protein
MPHFKQIKVNIFWPLFLILIAILTIKILIEIKCHAPNKSKKANTAKVHTGINYGIQNQNGSRVSPVALLVVMMASL